MDDIAPCQWQPVNPADYAAWLSEQQLDESRAIFRQGAAASASFCGTA